MIGKGGASLETTLQGCRIHYVLHRNEKADAPVVVLLHGWGCDGSVFSFLEREIVEQCTLLIIDFPGHGKSDEPPEPWGVPEYAQQMLSLLDELQLDRVYVVAHSFGGRVALELATKKPELIEKLVITGGAGIKKQPSPEQMKRQAAFKRMNKILNAVKKVPFLAGLADQLQTKLRQRYGSADYIRLNENMRKTFVKVISYDQLELLSQVKASTLLIWGSNDTETPLWMGQQMEKEIPDAGLIVFDGRGHFAFAEEWQRFTIILKQFFFGGQNA
ncbi:MAG: alpha/beta hydrolase [Clostridiales bacterium]|nr:alpha/beta hydrolase [Clostridiales bacterium]